jgi:hypothetical protein
VGDDFAAALDQLAERTDVEISLEIVQEIRDIEDRQAKGVFLSRDFIAWLGLARASLDIEQYIYHECGD